MHDVIGRSCLETAAAAAALSFVVVVVVVFTWNVNRKKKKIPILFNRKCIGKCWKLYCLMTDQDSNRSRDFQEEEDRLKRMSAERPVKRAGRRGRKPSKIDQKARLERSRQSARECRARKKLRYQYLEELVLLRERSIFSLREELERAWAWLDEIDAIFPEENMKLVNTDSLKCSPITGQATNKLRSLCHDLDHGIVVPSEVKKKIMKKTGEGSEADECHST